MIDIHDKGDYNNNRIRESPHLYKLHDTIEDPFSNIQPSNLAHHYHHSPSATSPPPPGGFNVRQKNAVHQSDSQYRETDYCPDSIDMAKQLCAEITDTENESYEHHLHSHYHDEEPTSSARPSPAPPLRSPPPLPPPPPPPPQNQSHYHPHEENYDGNSANETVLGTELASDVGASEECGDVARQCEDTFNSNGDFVGDGRENEEFIESQHHGAVGAQPCTYGVTDTSGITLQHVQVKVKAKMRHDNGYICNGDQANGEVAERNYDYCAQDVREEEQTMQNETHRESVATVANSFDQVADEIADDLDVLDQVAEQDVQDLAELIPERNQNRLFSKADPAPDPSEGGTLPGSDQGRSHAHVHAHAHGDVDEQSHHVHVHVHAHGHAYDETENEDIEEEAVYSVEDIPAGDENMIQDENGFTHEGALTNERNVDDEGNGQHVEQSEELQEFRREEVLETETAKIQSDNHPFSGRTGFITQDTARLSAPSDRTDSLPGPPPSFNLGDERLSRNMADAVATIWDRFWSDDIRAIARIIRNRFSQLMPYIRRFLAHVVAFWGGITYIRKAIAAFVRLLKRDERVRELLERLGWASATTLKVFLSMCTMIMQAALTFYQLMRDRVIPDTRRVIPILYYKLIVRLAAAARLSPWALVWGPFSLTFAIDGSKLPDRFYLHSLLSVPYDDVSFASMHDIVETVRASVYRSRYRATPNKFRDAGNSQYHATEMKASAEVGVGLGVGHANDTVSASTPVHTRSTDEVPMPPPDHRSGQKYHGGSKVRCMRRCSNGPLSERTNVDGLEE